MKPYSIIYRHYCLPILLMTCLSGCFSHGLLSSGKHSCQGLSFVWNDKICAIENISLYSSLIAGQGGLTFKDGKSNAPLIIERRTKPSLKDAKAAYFVDFKDKPGLSSIITFYQHTNYFILNIELINQGPEQQWIETALALPFSKDKFTYYDGLRENSSPAYRDMLGGTFPLSAIYRKGENGLAIGIEPHQLLSYLKSEVKETQDSLCLTYNNRIVIDPAKRENLKLVFFPFHAKYGYLDAIALYQDFFPDVFHAALGTHPEIKGAKDMFWGYEYNQRKGRMIRPYDFKVGELLRKIGLGWDWCYAGFGSRPGDWLCGDALTGDWLVKGSGYKKWREIHGMSATEYMREKLDAFTNTKYFRIAAMMYIIPDYCEEDLAKEKYADSIYYNAKGKPQKEGPPWVENDSSYVMYCYGNSFGDYTYKAVKEIVGRSDISGFSFDEMHMAHLNYFGPGADKSPGRAFQKERGVYSNLELANALFARYVHSLTNNHGRMGIVGNLAGGDAGSYLHAFNVDAGIMERDIWDDCENPFQLRLLMGKKSLTYLYGYRNLPALGTNDLEQLVTALADYSLLKSLKLGYYLDPVNLLGFPKLLHYNKLSQFLFRDLGWEPVPAFTADKNLWASRYGKGLGACLVAGNPTLQDIATSIEVDNPYLGNASFAFADFDRPQIVTSELNDAKTAVKDVCIPSRNPAILQAVLSVKTKEAIKIQSVIDLPLAQEGHYSFDIMPSKAGSYDLSFYIPKDRHPGKLMLNEKEIKYNTGQDKITAGIQLEEQNKVVLTLLPDIEVVRLQDVLDFPFVEKQKSNFTVILPTQAFQDDVYLAQRLAGFFDLAICGPDPLRQTLDIRIERQSEIPKDKGNCVVIGTPATCPLIKDTKPDFIYKKGMIQRKNNLLFITACDLNSLENTMDVLLALLEMRYPFYGYVMASEDRLNDKGYLQKTYFFKRTGIDFVPWIKPQKQ